MSEVASSLVTKLIVVAIVSLLSYFYRTRIISKIRNLIYWISNAEIHLSTKRVDYFGIPTEGEFGPEMTHELFEHLQERYPERIDDPDYSHNKLSVNVDGIPSRVNIILEKRMEFEGMEPILKGYKLLVETNSEFRIGYRSVDALDEFQDLSNIVSTLVLSSHFDSQAPETSVIICDLTKGVPAGVDEIEDSDLDISGRVTDSVLHLTIKNPRNLTKGVRKYFTPRIAYTM